MSFTLKQDGNAWTLTIDSKTVVGLFFESVRGATELLRKDVQTINGKKTKTTITADAADRTTLLAAVVSHALKTALEASSVVKNIFFKQLTETHAEAELELVHAEQYEHRVTSAEAIGVAEKSEEGEWHVVLRVT